MLQLVTIDLSNADFDLFANYETKVLALLQKHGGRLEMRVRAIDGRSETHLIYFPDNDAFERYRSDPIRLAALSEWDRSGARSVVTEVERVAGGRWR
jgi:uncharacterized protein (DUF1330 family)